MVTPSADVLPVCPPSSKAILRDDGIGTDKRLDGYVSRWTFWITITTLTTLRSGWGEQMINTHSVIMWKNTDGSISLSQRYARGYRQPEVVADPPRIAKLVEPRKSVTRPPNSLTFAFQVPVNHTLLRSHDASEKMIFATSSVTPAGKDVDANIPRHEHVGYFTFDLTKDFKDVTLAASPNNAPTAPQYTTGPLKKVEKLMILHGAIVSFGFLVLLPAGSLLGRYGRVIAPHKWFRLHRLSNGVIALPVITLGVLLGPLVVYNKETFRKHFANPHEVCGILLLFMYFAQISLGQYIHHRRLQIAKQGPVTKPHPPLNILHIVLGVSIIGLAFFQVRVRFLLLLACCSRRNRSVIMKRLSRLIIAVLILNLFLDHPGSQRSSMVGNTHESWAVVPLGSPSLEDMDHFIFALQILPIAYFGGYALLPRQLRQERAAAYAPLPRDTSDSAHLLADEGH
ncbi:hypothetical protein CVT24_010873 [Panaeolus cyanescens]|uniref:Cytochrome b561 domain-containing protein n=1 Tax=Panaeolus cyanescens TaxID=181874 RepID=A0A409YYC4_9AGAR|nr:hypothetical protein CVT24_010873 [Panaeolus cyanescens]